MSSTTPRSPLKTFVEVCHTKGVPVIVDAASEYDLRMFLAAGADVAIYSGHKFLGGPTSGVVAGSKDLIRACYLQNHGIGRGMKVGKETIVGVAAALTAWKTRDHAGIRIREQSALDTWVAALADRPGVTATIVPDPTNNPLDRIKVSIDPEEARITAWNLAMRLAAGTARSSSATTRSSTATSSSTPRTSIPGRSTSSPSACSKSSARPRSPTTSSPPHSTNSASPAKPQPSTGPTERRDARHLEFPSLQFPSHFVAVHCSKLPD